MGLISKKENTREEAERQLEEGLQQAMQEADKVAPMPNKLDGLIENAKYSEHCAATFEKLLNDASQRTAAIEQEMEERRRRHKDWIARYEKILADQYEVMHMCQQALRKGGE